MKPYFIDGIPKYIACYEQKKNPAFDRFTVVFTHLNWIGYLPGRIEYRAMSAHPYHPQGFGQRGEAERGRFRPGGSRIEFTSLPEDCQRLIRNDYAEMWGLDVTADWTCTKALFWKEVEQVKGRLRWSHERAGNTGTKRYAPDNREQEPGKPSTRGAKKGNNA
jgi:hypothetical protein